MTAADPAVRPVFVHGNPETAAVWAPLLDALGHDGAVCLSPPGFGAPLPEGHGHWWMTVDPAGAARVLRRFWARASPP